MKIFKVILIFIFISQTCNSQSDSLKIQSIDKRVYEIEKENKKEIAEYTQQIDTINIRVSKFKNRIAIINNFQNNKSTLNANFYFDEDELIFISFVEPSTKTEKDREKNFREYYYECGKLIHKNYYTELSSFAVCLTIPKDTDRFEFYGFNKNLTDDFYSRYIDKLKEENIIPE